MLLTHRRTALILAPFLTVALLLSAFFPARSANAALGLPYTETWESGTSDGWTNLCINPFEFCLGGNATVTNDPAGKHGKVQVIKRETQGGDQFSPELAAQPNHTYCVSAWINWVGGGAPYIGVSYNRAGTSSGWNVIWLIGAAEGGASTVIPTSASGWHQYHARFPSSPVSTAMHLVDEVSNGPSHRKGGSPLAYFDNLSIGDCSPASPPSPSSPAVAILAARVEKNGAPADLTRPPLRVVKAGQKVLLAVYVKVARNAVKGATISFTFREKRGAAEVLSKTAQASVHGTLPTELRRTVAVQPQKKGTYTFTGTISYAGQSQQRSTTFTVAGSTKKTCVIILGTRYCKPH